MSVDHAVARRTLAIFGGTFDPVHIGHLRMALELKQHLQLDEMRLMPCHLPPHREAPGVTSEHRAAMARLAVADCAELSVDERELRREKTSYTLDTLIELRAELGDEVSLCMAMGMDSLVNLHTWHRWTELLDYCHILVAARPGWTLPENGDVAALLKRCEGNIEALREHSCGSIVVETLRLLPVSATEIRAQISAGESPQFLLPEAVWRYIREQGLYQS